MAEYESRAGGAALSIEKVVIKGGRTVALLKTAGRSLMKSGAGASLSMGAQLLGEMIGGEKTGWYLAFIGAGAQALIDGDPSALIITGLTLAYATWQKAVAAQKVRMNYDDAPEKVYGKRYGYVRENGMWYPAFIDMRIKHFGGLGVDRNTVIMTYGQNVGEENLHYELYNGKLYPTFTAWSKQLVIPNPRDMDLQQGRYRQLRDGLRNYYFLDKDQTHQLLSGDRMKAPVYRDFIAHMDDHNDYINEGGDPKVQEAHESLLNLNQAMDIWRDYKFRFDKDYGVSIGTVSAGHALKTHAKWITGEDDKRYIDLKGHYKGDYTIHHDYMKKDKSFTDWGAHSESDILGPLLIEQVQDLLRNQRLAAKQSGYPRVDTEKRRGYMPNKWIIFDHNSYDDPNDPHHHDKLNDYFKWTDARYNVDVNTPYRAYMDFSKDQPTAQNPAELSTQLYKISQMKDRTNIQQNYLANKVYTRYLMNQMNLRGGADTFVDTLYSPAKMRYTGDPNNPTFTEQRGQLHNFDEDARGLLRWSNDDYLMPWATEEDGTNLLPSFMNIMSSGNRDRLAQDSSLLNLNKKAEAWALSHANNLPPEHLTDILTGEGMVDHRDIDWQRKNPEALANVRLHGNVHGELDDSAFKTGAQKINRLAELANYKKMRAELQLVHKRDFVLPLLEHDPSHFKDPYYQRRLPGPEGKPGKGAHYFSWDPLLKKYVRIHDEYKAPRAEWTVNISPPIVAHTGAQLPKTKASIRYTEKDLSYDRLHGLWKNQQHMSKGEMQALRDYWDMYPNLAPGYHAENTKSAWWHPPSLVDPTVQTKPKKGEHTGWVVTIHAKQTKKVPKKVPRGRYVDRHDYGYIYRNFWAKGKHMNKAQVKVLQDYWAAHPDLAPGRTKHEAHIHGPIVGTDAQVDSILIHHAPEPLVEETSAPAHIPTLPHPMDNAPLHIPHMLPFKPHMPPPTVPVT
jgi:hypothetical protein